MVAIGPRYSSALHAIEPFASLDCPQTAGAPYGIDGSESELHRIRMSTANGGSEAKIRGGCR